MRNYTFTGAFLLGIGMVGMLDGIIFHQILQWHSTFMHTDRFHQIVSDGIFHLIVTIILFIGAVLLWKSDPQDNGHRPEIFWGGLLVGGGLFNLAEGLVNHHILGVHHVKAGPYQLYYDLSFDAAALLILLSGVVQIRRQRTVKGEPGEAK
ncbi:MULTISPECIES: DUF2243 domain-containing protein [Paenibacillus]|uniref:DUF2243 domain-containing protein n=1 Tax=Paenibacillus residui TaxID=629724 RepID=A0ABW3D706_9BACL